MSLFMQSSMFCGLKDGPENLLHSLVRVIEPKFTRDANNFPATGFQSQEDEIHITWMLNLSVLEGLFTKFQVPKRVASKYPLMIANIFELFHKTLASVIGKGGNNYIILRKYIKVNKLFCEKFNYYSPVNIDIRQHLELFEFVCNTYFIYVKNRLPHSMRIEEDNENHKILKFIRKWCVSV
ncbi:hypothetical protein RF11_01575 [Thelohanellus kitauei]|uniref:Uncharacterized protein n=1 Tax=Thelohanellus kitauei TaxID=669202 RepID=A0A0C2JJ22_THEKT|nr:hypothetical protein RF11_01575 [Thelohanellus kitauei]